MPHDKMFEMAEVEGTTKTRSWTEGGAYSKPRPSAATIAQCAPYRFAPLADVADEAADEAEASTD